VTLLFRNKGLNINSKKHAFRVITCLSMGHFFCLIPSNMSLRPSHLMGFQQKLLRNE